MVNTFMRSPLPNSLAVAVLVALVGTWVLCIVLSLRDKPIDPGRGWYAALVPLFSVLGLPAALDLLQADTVARAYAAIVFAVLIVNLVMPIIRWRGSSANILITDWQRWSMLFTALAGLGVAAYLALVDSAGGQVACGPSGGCATVQHSKYAMLFGGVPVAAVGLIGYVGIVAAWMVWQLRRDTFSKQAPLAIWAMCIFGTLFSTYLTFLEPFVIGATCMWCISSAVLMAQLMLLSTPIARDVLNPPEGEDDAFDEEFANSPVGRAEK